MRKCFASTKGNLDALRPAIRAGTLSRGHRVIRVVSGLYRAARLSRTGQVGASGDPDKITRRVGNLLIGRMVVRRLWLRPGRTLPGAASLFVGGGTSAMTASHARARIAASQAPPSVVSVALITLAAGALTFLAAFAVFVAWEATAGWTADSWVLLLSCLVAGLASGSLAWMVMVRRRIRSCLLVLAPARDSAPAWVADVYWMSDGWTRGGAVITADGDAVIFGVDGQVQAARDAYARLRPDPLTTPGADRAGSGGAL